MGWQKWVVFAMLLEIGMIGMANASDVREMVAPPNGYFAEHRNYFITNSLPDVTVLKDLVPVENAVRTAQATVVIPEVAKINESEKAPVVKEEGKTKELLNVSEEVLIPGDKVTVRFGFDKFRLGSNEAKKIQAVVADLKTSEAVKVSGYTCDIGTEKYNLALSKKRAYQVKRHLVKLGIPESRVEANGLGECCPVSKNRTENRRVEVEGLVKNSSQKTLPKEVLPQ